MLKRIYRFRGLGSVRPAMQHGQVGRDKGGLFTVKALATRRENPRAAVVISRKAAKKATDRNRLRRRIYEILRLHWAKLDGQSVDVVVIVHDGRLDELTAPRLEDRLLLALGRAMSTTNPGGHDRLEGTRT